MSLKHEQYLKVPCCTECNSLLGDSLQASLIDRERELKFRLEQRHWKDLNMPIWKPSELNTLKRTLRSYVEGKQKARLRTEARLEYNEGIQAYINSLEAQDPYQAIIA